MTCNMKQYIIGTSDTFTVANGLSPAKGLLMMRTMPWEGACAVCLFTKRRNHKERHQWG